MFFFFILLLGLQLAYKGLSVIRQDFTRDVHASRVVKRVATRLEFNSVCPTVPSKLSRVFQILVI